jgi:predicted transcriptional regulator
MSMYTERLQVLISPAQRRRLESEARARGSSVAAVVRDAIDASLDVPTREERIRAVETIKAMKGKHLPVEEIEAIIGEERDANFPLAPRA